MLTRCLMTRLGFVNFLRISQVERCVHSSRGHQKRRGERALTNRTPRLSDQIFCRLKRPCAKYLQRKFFACWCCISHIHWCWACPVVPCLGCYRAQRVCTIMLNRCVSNIGTFVFQKFLPWIDRRTQRAEKRGRWRRNGHTGVCLPRSIKVAVLGGDIAGAISYYSPTHLTCELFTRFGFSFSPGRRSSSDRRAELEKTK